MNREFLIPGIVALALAVLFPLYWFSGLFSTTGESLLEAFKADASSLTLIDGLFVLIGTMEIYLLLSLRRILQHQLYSAFAAGMALAMAIGIGVFTATVLFDVSIALTPGMAESTRSTLVLVAGLVSLGLSVLVGLIGLALSIALLALRNDGTVLLKIFAAMLLICSLMTMTVILAPVVYVFYPVALVLLAAFFLRGGGEVEVV
ncbi:hypothetical protein IC757_14020 [Wenzhouxiangella sp. AB-CW3]|uniref:hypothetical protein n=1 Tax=Wenzhouxiangella sp. AB-CW3 TaxID=2771012 RepID=UPI00168BA7A4|nr:hypothetical protein [Wenzhouxiangella sp. AB-CW3]QOC22124.1 hypothetical protein IC757_14020 [Wenzhouxiangella sp. AB-CW3]